MARERRIKEIPPVKASLLTPVKLKACAYVRVSTRHVEQKNSFENQVEYYERFLKKNSSYEYCGIFSDAGISGHKEERPGFKAMLAKAEAGGLDIIMTKSISRFARDTVLLLKYVRALKEVGVAIIFEEQNINTLSSEGELLLTVLGTFAEEERKSVCKNIAWSTRNRFKQGIVALDTSRILGYDKDSSGNLIINEEEANIVQEIYKRYLSGASAYKIARDLGVNSQRVLRILSNERYKGDCLLQKTYVTAQGKQVKNTGQLAKYYIEKSHPAIISDADWEAAQKIRAKRKKQSYPFSSKLFCGFCGAVLIRVTQEKLYVSWVCCTYLRGSKAACIGTRIADRVLQEVFKDNSITEPMIVEEVCHGKRKRTKEDYRIIPAAQYKK